MNRTAFRIWTAICWIVTIGIAYIIGWYKGARSVATMAVSTAHSSINVILVVLAIVAVVSAIAAFKTRGYFDKQSA